MSAIVPVKPSGEDAARYRANILATYQQATPDQHQRGRTWYVTANQLAGVLAQGDTRKGAGVIAALSANKSWRTNKNIATRCFAGEMSGHTRDNLRKVARIIEGEDPTDVLPMHAKTGHFFRCIADPTDADAVVVDRHAHDIAVGRPMGEAERGLSSKGRYSALADAYRDVARWVSRTPMELQAITWLVQVESLAGTSTRSSEHSPKE